ncbi:hypothetical protein E3G68_005181 [Mycobacteroides abscessus]|uniref:hypothetical protein n=1 Tax=Mycobacteroides abscessus TaxID=36809 RepID=UPI001877F7C9|nr:hypothetical protein [Mycobacteroides abscessus]
MRYRRLEYIQAHGTPQEAEWVDTFLDYQAFIHGHSKPREQTWRFAEELWLKTVKLHMALQEDFPEWEAMYDLTGLMTADNRLAKWRKSWRRKFRDLLGK